MLAMPLLVYALYCAYRDREATRARRHRNPYSLADRLVREYQRKDFGYSSAGQLYGYATSNAPYTYTNRTHG